MQHPQLIKLFIQAVIAVSLLLNPVSGHSTTVFSGHPKINTEWVSTQQVKTKITAKKKQNHRLIDRPTHYPRAYRFDLRCISITKSQQQNYFIPGSLLQKTIPYGTDDELIA
ncbi:MAG: hypothetical protein KF763_10335 [Cyclobacteriaceae bacterium]|nr:hypothetical protein [Cyclobacteriaceae bacterium]